MALSPSNHLNIQKYLKQGLRSGAEYLRPPGSANSTEQQILKLQAQVSRLPKAQKSPNPAYQGPLLMRLV